MAKIGFYNLCFEFGQFVDARSNIDVLTLVFDHFRTGLVYVLCVNMILGFQNRASTQLRAQTFDIRLDGECRIGTLIRRYLTYSQVFKLSKIV